MGKPSATQGISPVATEATEVVEVKVPLPIIAPVQVPGLGVSIPVLVLLSGIVMSAGHGKRLFLAMKLINAALMACCLLLVLTILACINCALMYERMPPSNNETINITRAISTKEKPR